MKKDRYKVEEAKDFIVLDQEGRVLSVCDYAQALKKARSNNAAIYINQGLTAPTLVKDYAQVKAAREAMQRVQSKPGEPATPVVKLSQRKRAQTWTEEDATRAKELIAKLKEDGDLPFDQDEELSKLKKKYERYYHEEETGSNGSAGTPE